MNEALVTYFAGEKGAGAALAGIGLVMAASAVLSLRLQGRAFSATLAVWALLQLAIGVGLYLKTDAQVGGLAQQLGNDVAAFYAAEQPRMAIVQRNFVLLEALWLALICGSALVAVRWKANLTVSGIAVGMLINTTLLLAFDLVAERRGGVYLAALRAGSPQGP